MKTLTLLAMASLFALGCDHAGDVPPADPAGASAAPIPGDPGPVSTEAPLPNTTVETDPVPSSATPTAPAATATRPKPAALPTPPAHAVKKPEPVAVTSSPEPEPVAVPPTSEPAPVAVPPTSEPAPEFKTEEDFEDQATREITDDNLEAELAALEKEIG